jgi:hypothetical protein
MSLTHPILSFEISRQFQQNNEEIIAKFKNEKDALEFMAAKIIWDHKTKVQTVYKLYQDKKIIKTIDAMRQETLDSSGDSDGGSSGGQGSGAGKRFNPTPLATSPKPAGSVPYRQNEDDTDDV